LRILLLSDTHIPSRARTLPPGLWERFSSADLVLHAGDLESADILDEMESVARDFRAVRGNMDPPSLSSRLPELEILEVEDITLALVHGHQWGRPRPTRVAQEMAGRADVVVFGHNHIPAVRKLGGVLVVNPGSPTCPRGHLGPTCALLTVEGEKADVEVIEVESD